MEEISNLLFNKIYDDSELHPNFLNIANENSSYARDVIKKWAKGFSDRDGKFVKEFQTTFNSSFWELYLFAVLKELKFKVSLNHSRPDFVIPGDNGFLIEATTANHAKDETPEWSKSNLVEEINKWTEEEIVDNATLRLANAFIGKSRKYSESYKDLPHAKGKPYVIAIAPFDSPFFFFQNHQAIQRVLYGFDRYIAIDWDYKTRDILDEISMEDIEKKTGSKVPLGYFNNPDYSHVSAVIFNNAATFSKVRLLSEDPRITMVRYRRYNRYGTQPLEGVIEKSSFKEHLLDGMTVFHNPYAQIPFNIEEFYHPIIGHFGYNVEEERHVSNIPHGFLFNRQAIVMNGYSESFEKLRQLRKEVTNNMIFPKFHH